MEELITQAEVVKKIEDFLREEFGTIGKISIEPVHIPFGNIKLVDDTVLTSKDFCVDVDVNFKVVGKK